MVLHKLHKMHFKLGFEKIFITAINYSLKVLENFYQNVQL